MAPAKTPAATAKKKKVHKAPKVVLNSRYERGEALGSGAFGTIYKAYDTKTQQHVAIKAESFGSDHNQLPKEHAVYQKLGKLEGFLEVYDFFSQNGYRYLVFTLVDTSLEKVVHKLKEKKLDLKSTLMIAIQLIKHIQNLHKKHYLHRDIKPDNMAMGIGKEAATLFLLDLGLGKQFMHGGIHNDKVTGKNLVGTARYASLNSHRGWELSRRDDLESIAYVLIYLMKGKLPWQGLESDFHGHKYDRIKQIKKEYYPGKLCQGLEPEFTKFLEYTRSLHYADEPDYTFCIRLFESCMKRKKLVYDDIYPWTKETDPAKIKLKRAQEEEEARQRRAKELQRRKLLNRKFKYPATRVDKFFSDSLGLTLEEKQAIIRENMANGAMFPTLAPPLYPPVKKEITATATDQVEGGEEVKVTFVNEDLNAANDGAPIAADKPAALSSKVENDVDVPSKSQAENDVGVAATTKEDQAPTPADKDVDVPAKPTEAPDVDVPAQDAASEQDKKDDKPPACAVTAVVAAANQKKRKKSKKRKASEANINTVDEPNKKTRAQQQAEMLAIAQQQAKQEQEARARIEAERNQNHRLLTVLNQSSPRAHQPAYINNHHLPQAAQHYKPCPNNYYPSLQYNQIGAGGLPKFQQRQVPFQPYITFNPSFGMPIQQPMIQKQNDGFFLF